MSLSMPVHKTGSRHVRKIIVFALATTLFLILVYFGYYRSYGLASRRDIHGKPPTQNSLQ